MGKCSHDPDGVAVVGAVAGGAGAGGVGAGVSDVVGAVAEECQLVA